MGTPTASSPSLCGSQNLERNRLVLKSTMSWGISQTGSHWLLHGFRGSWPDHPTTQTEHQVSREVSAPLWPHSKEVPRPGLKHGFAWLLRNLLFCSRPVSPVHRLAAVHETKPKTLKSLTVLQPLSATSLQLWSL